MDILLSRRRGLSIMIVSILISMIILLLISYLSISYNISLAIEEADKYIVDYAKAIYLVRKMYNETIILDCIDEDIHDEYVVLYIDRVGYRIEYNISFNSLDNGFGRNTSVSLYRV